MNRNLLVSRDWFFSHLFRDLIRAKLGSRVPEGVLDRFISHDTKGNYREFDDPFRRKEDQ